MKKIISAAMAVIGILAVAAMVFTVGRFGSYNMSRVSQQAYQWRLEHHGP